MTPTARAGGACFLGLGELCGIDLRWAFVVVRTPRGPFAFFPSPPSLIHSSTTTIIITMIRYPPVAPVRGCCLASDDLFLLREFVLELITKVGDG